MNDIEIMQTLIKAKELGITQSDVDAYKEKIKQSYVPEMKAEEIVKPISVLDDLSDEELLYWSTPYYDDLQAKKQSQQEKEKMSDEHN
jgi:uncharacterized HAD superfamily protein